jgi:hypothetical protein
VAAAEVGEVDRDFAVEAARSRQRVVEDVGAVRGGDDDDAAHLLEAVHLDEELVKRLVLIGRCGVLPAAAAATEGVNLVDEDDAGRELAGAREESPDAGRAEPRELLLKARPRDGQERHLRLGGRGASKECLAGARRAGEQHAARRAPAESAERQGVAQEFDGLGQFRLGLVNPGDLVERHRLIAAHVCELEIAGAADAGVEAPADEAEGEQHQDGQAPVED